MAAKRSYANLNKYDALMDGLVDVGINRIDNVEFKSSKMEALQSDTKVSHTKCKTKAEDFVSVFKIKSRESNDYFRQYTDVLPTKTYVWELENHGDGGRWWWRSKRKLWQQEKLGLVVNVSVSFVLE